MGCIYNFKWSATPSSFPLLGPPSHPNILYPCISLFTCVVKAKAGLGVQSLRPSVRPSQNLVIATPLKLLTKLS